MKFLGWHMVVCLNKEPNEKALAINATPIGAYAEYIAVSTHMLIHKPRELTWEEAAGIPEVSSPHSVLFEILILTVVFRCI